MRILVFSLLLSFFSTPLFSYPEYLQDYNKPYEKWFKTETDHCRIFYLSGLKEQAEITASIAEEVIPGMLSTYGTTLKDKIDIIVYDEDYSNGWAAWMLNTIKVWVADLDFPLRGTHHWLRDVVTHELAHVISMQAGQKTRYNITDIRFGYFDYFNEKNQASAFSVYSFDVFPNWLAEGIAQYESEKKGHDAWDAHRDMLLRMKVLGNGLLPVEQMNFFAGRSFDMEGGPYNQGFAMVRWIVKKYGEEKLTALVDACAAPGNLTYPMAVRDVFHKSMRALYEEWAADEKAGYLKRKEGLGLLAEGRPLQKDSTVSLGFKSFYPRWGVGDDKLYFLSNGEGNDASRGSLMSWDFSDTIKEEKERLKPAAPYVSTYFSLSDSDRFVTFTSPSFNPIKGESYTDAFTDTIRESKFIDDVKLALAPNRIENGKSVAKTIRWLTRRNHIMQSCVNAKGTRVALVRKVQNRHSLVLIDNRNIEYKAISSRVTGLLLDVEWNKHGKNPEKIIFEPDSQGKDGFSIYTPRFSPNDSLVVFSFFEGKTRDLGLVDTFGNYTRLLATDADERDPDFTHDGKYVVFSSDRTGIFNLYRLELATGKVEQVTNVLGGAFCPAVSRDNARIAYANFDTAGYSLYLIENKALSGLPAAEPTAPSAPFVSNTDFTNSRKQYFPVFTRVLFSPMVVGEELVADDAAARQGKFGVKAGGVLTLMDPLMKNTLYLIGLMEVGKGLDWVGSDYGKHLFFNPAYDKDFMVLFENRSFYPTIGLEMDKFLVHQRDDFYNVIEERYQPDNYLIDIQRYRASLRVPFFSPLRKLQAGLTYSVQSADFYDLDPNFALEYTFFKEWNPYLMFTHLNMAGTGMGWRQEDNVDTRGTYLKVKYDWFSDQVLTDGASWQESFEISDMGVLQPLFTDSRHRRLTLDLRHAREAPFLPLLTLGGEARVSAADRPVDNFLYPGIFMKSMPFLSDRSNLYFLGRNTFRAEGYARFPLARRIRTGLGPLLLDKLYGMAFFEAGATGGIDPSEAGRQDLDAFYRQGRKVEKYMARMATSDNSARTRQYFDTKEEMEEAIRDYSNPRSGFHFDSLDKHVIYEMLPDDTVRGFAENLATLKDAPMRLGFGLELRMENYIAPGYPFFITLRYSQSLDRDDPSGSFKEYFTSNPLDNPAAFVYFNIGFSFDGWDLIDIPEYHNPVR